MSGLANAHRSSSREKTAVSSSPEEKYSPDETAHDQQGILERIYPGLGTHNGKWL
jgi:hypothetical protein